MTTDLIAQLEECAEHKLSEAWSRVDGGADLCIGAALASEAANALSDLQADNQRLREALRPFGDAADHAIGCIGKTTTLGVLGALAPYFVTWQDFSRARAALRSTEEGNK